MKTKGLVMDVQQNTVIVLTRDARFVRLPKRGHVEIGEEYSYSQPRISSFLAAASVMLMLISSMFAPFLSKPIPVAYVSVDINPSLELTVAQTGKVMEAEALNQEAESLLQELQLKGVPLDRAVTKIYNAATEMGYVENNESFVLLAAVPINSETELPEKVNKVLASYTSANGPESSRPNTVALVLTNNELRDKAKAEGLSTGKYTVYLEAQSKGHIVEIASLQTKGIARALRDENVAPAAVLERIEKEKDFILLAEHVQQAIAQRQKIAQNNHENIPEVKPEEDKKPAETVKPDTATISQKPDTVKDKDAGKKPENDIPPVEPTEPDTEEEPVVEEPVQEPEEEDVPIILPAENDPILEEARRGFFDWFKDFFVQQ